MDAEFQYSSKENGGVNSLPPDDQTLPRRKVVLFDNDVGGGTGRRMLVDEGKLRNRLEPYNNIAVIATLLAGFALTIFPSGMDDDLDDSDFPWALTGHVLYNGLMGLSFTINLVVTVMLTMELYFTQLLVARHSLVIATRYLDSTEYSRRIAVFIFYAVSIPAFLVAFTILLFAALHTVAAIITSLATLGGLFIVLLCIRQYYIVYRKANEGVTSFGEISDEVIVSPVSPRSSVGRGGAGSDHSREKTIDGVIVRNIG